MEDQNSQHQESDNKGEPICEPDAIQDGDIKVTHESESEHPDEKQEAQQEPELVEKCEDDCSKVDKSTAVDSSALVVTETQEVVSSSARDASGSISRSTRRLSKSRSSAGRKGSYQASRSYTASFQNYGLAYLPYKSNFEPSEDARRRADEFVKTLKL